MKKNLPLIFLVFIFSNTSLAQVNFESSNLPIIIINTNGTAIPLDIKTTADMGIIYNGVGVRNELLDSLNNYDGKIGIEFRGSSSLAIYDKKGYSIETRNNDGSNNNVSLLGMPEENDWVLHGPFGDKSLIRNVMAYKIASNLMEYAPRTQLVELVLNDDYQGVYVLTEKIKRDKNRVDISKLNPDEIDGDDLTGGYIVKVDKFDGENVGGWLSDYGAKVYSSPTTFYQYHYPKPDQISVEQQIYIQDWFRTFEDVLVSEEFNDPLSGFQAYIDVNTFIQFIFVNEITRNVDGYRLSTFLYKDKDSIDGRLKAGPVWDFNLGFANANYCDGWKTEGWAFNFDEVCPDDFFFMPFWWRKMVTDKSFHTQMLEQWTTLRNDVLSTDRLMNCIDSLALLLEEAQVRNFERWPIMGEWIWPNSYISDDYQEEIILLKDWLTRRLNWLDWAMPRIDEQLNFNPAIEGAVKFFPNPMGDQLKIRYHLRQGATFRIDVYSHHGFKIDEINGTAPVQGDNTYLWNRNAAPGLYIFHFWQGDTLRKIGKIIKH